MKVYQVIHRQFDWGGRTNHESLGTYADEEKAKAHLEEIKAKIVSGATLVVEDFDGGEKYGKGFSYGSTLGSMSFIPGAYSIVEQEVQ